jgi:hypothetical protein
VKIIEVIIRPDGQSTIETTGFSGSSCRDASRFLELALGSTASETLTAEYHQAASSSQFQHESGA